MYRVYGGELEDRGPDSNFEGHFSGGGEGNRGEIRRNIFIFELAREICLEFINVQIKIVSLSSLASPAPKKRMLLVLLFLLVVVGSKRRDEERPKLKDFPLFSSSSLLLPHSTFLQNAAAAAASKK